MGATLSLVKGHGTQNDFLVLPDLDGALELTADLTRALCDRHRGIGADGVLRVVRTAHVPEAADQAGDAEFFMDYRNADGSVAEMCGNGIRVFVRYLQSVGLVEQDAAVATRGGIKRTRFAGDFYTVDMGRPQVLADRPVVTAAPVAARPGRVVHMPNPHVVVPVDADTLDALHLRKAPQVVPPLPDGQNVEFVVRAGPRELRMRVHERGSGETRSCGTGICAAVVAAVLDDGGDGGDGSTWTVRVPGGVCTVVWRTDGPIELTGPAVLVGTVEVDLASL